MHRVLCFAPPIDMRMRMADYFRLSIITVQVVKYLVSRRSA